MSRDPRFLGPRDPGHPDPDADFLTRGTDCILTLGRQLFATPGAIDITSMSLKITLESQKWQLLPAPGAPGLSSLNVEIKFINHDIHHVVRKGHLKR